MSWLVGALLLCLPVGIVAVIWTHDPRWFVSGAVLFIAGLVTAWVLGTADET